MMDPQKVEIYCQETEKSRYVTYCCLGTCLLYGLPLLRFIADPAQCACPLPAAMEQRKSETVSRMIPQNGWVVTTTRSLFGENKSSYLPAGHAMYFTNNCTMNAVWFKIHFLSTWLKFLILFEGWILNVSFSWKLCDKGYHTVWKKAVTQILWEMVFYLPKFFIWWEIA